MNLAIDICCALEYCEKLGVVHRDVKKENIFVSSEGIYKLGDFGIAMFLDDMDKTMSAKGTYTCIAPEVYKNGDYSFSSDIYSLGIVLYCFMNNNRMPFLPSDVSVNITHGDREEAIFKRLNGGTISPPQNASEEFSKIIIKACSYEKSSRYKSASELKKDLLLITNSNFALE
ncbi:hypothetical protein C818_03298 [Lachnospiraceae bacterium MD308]|nr:hypothetical protein C818_03298 [Lachnospiraceae bacterium MD308]